MEKCQERICQENVKNVKNRPQLHRSQLQAAPALKPHKIPLALIRILLIFTIPQLPTTTTNVLNLGRLTKILNQGRGDLLNINDTRIVPVHQMAGMSKAGLIYCIFCIFVFLFFFVFFCCCIFVF